MQLKVELVRPAGAAKLLCAAVLGALFGCSPAPVPVDLLVENVTVYSGSDSTPFIASVAIRDGRFFEIGPPDASSIVANETIDGTGKFMTPGLWDAHAHVRSSKERGLNVETFLESGVTSIRDMGGYAERLGLIRQEINGGATPGPNIYPSYFMLNGESFADYQRVVTTEAEIEVAINELVSLGAFQVKVHRALSPEMLPVVVRLAHARDLTVTGHIPLGAHPLDACQIGMDGIEHVGSIVEAVMSAGENSSSVAIDYLTSDAAQPLYDCLSARNIAITPTLAMYPVIARRRAAGGEIPPEFIAFIESMKQITYRLYESGVTLLTGTDVSDLNDLMSIVPGKSLLEEMVLLEEAGIPPTAIITMATLNVAQSVGLARTTGSVEPGKNADFLLLAADPGESVRNFESIVSVYKMGREVFSAAK
jgi:imidazolonepropionase-like amidohydrolase